jgi:hypothetical protein
LWGSYEILENIRVLSTLPLLKGTQYCDVTLKSLIAEAGDEVLKYFTAKGKVKAWLNVELPQVRNPRVDLLARLESDDLLHIELQSSNDMTPDRMLEYAVGIWRQTGDFPMQVLLYVGNEPLRMTNHAAIKRLDYGYELIDIRDWDGDAMLQSDSVAVNILSVLARIRDRPKAIRRIIMRIARLPAPRRVEALRKLFLLAGVRGLAAKIEEERECMPVEFDIMDHDVLGPAIRKGMEEGRTQGIEEGRTRGIEDGERQILRLLIEKRFGPLPAWAAERLTNCTEQTLQVLAVRLLDARSLDELFA